MFFSLHRRDPLNKNKTSPKNIKEQNLQMSPQDNFSLEISFEEKSFVFSDPISVFLSSAPKLSPTKQDMSHITTATSSSGSKKKADLGIFVAPVQVWLFFGTD